MQTCELIQHSAHFIDDWQKIHKMYRFNSALRLSFSRLKNLKFEVSKFRCKFLCFKTVIILLAWARCCHSPLSFWFVKTCQFVYICLFVFFVCIFIYLLEEEKWLDLHGERSFCGLFDRMCLAQQFNANNRMLRNKSLRFSFSKRINESKSMHLQNPTYNLRNSHFVDGVANRNRRAWHYCGCGCCYC